MALLLFLVPPRGRLAAQLSPGPLARPHHALEGALRCTKCHAGGKEAMSAQCAGCHKDIGWLASRSSGFHGKEAKGQSCAACHPDHAGEGFALVKWPDGSQERFDHRRAGWALEQSHAQARCSDCHTARFQVSPAARLSPRKQPGGWTGLETPCAGCHEDVHRGALGPECARCHDAGAWKTTPGFSHDTTDYPLTSRHAAVPCGKCHLDTKLAPRTDPQGHAIPVYQPVPHQSCSECHTDPHAGALGPGCADCHTTRGFRQVDKDHFNHARTRYPLTGRHAVLRCAACHGEFTTAAARKPAFAACATCHTDAHRGTATLAGKPVDCSACHTVAGFVPASYTVAQHRQARFPLEGKHQVAGCGSCHVRSAVAADTLRLGSARVVLRPASGACRDCHADDHGGQLASRPGKGECAPCHTVAGWTPSRFDAEAHATLRLALDGRHAEVNCRACHGAERKGLPPLPAAVPLGRAKVLLPIREVTCAQCHSDPHGGRFVAGGARAKASGCAACHDARAYRPSSADVAAHRGFGFALEGAHRATACVACHAEMRTTTAAPRSSLIAFAWTGAPLRFESKTTCAGCHTTVHGTQFDGRPDGGRCDACHTVDAFVPAARFDHDRQAAFSLKGAHTTVPCNRCHPSDLAGGDPGRLVFRPVSGKCESCHAGKEVR